jgi:hypothetical protein
MTAQAETTLAKPRARAKDAEAAESGALSGSMRKLILSFTQTESDRTESATDDSGKDKD